MNEIEWAHLNDALRILVTPLAVFVVVQLQKILGQLRTLNGRMIKLETQAVEHSSDDDHRFNAIQRDLDNVRGYRGG